MNKSLVLDVLLLPEEIIEDILTLSRLPVKLLLKFRCISKSWLFLIDSDRFIKIHLRNSRKITNHSAIYHNMKKCARNGCSVQSVSILNSDERTLVIADPKPVMFGYVMGYCNSVLCLSNFPYDEMALCNPATTFFMLLPRIDRLSPKCGFGWDESTAAFKVFAVVKGSGQLYSSKTNSWKAVPLGCESLFDFIGVFVAGRLHWPMGFRDSDKHAIESFDLASDEFGRIELPPFNANAAEGGQPRTCLGEIGGCLCTLFDFKKSVDIWVMKEYGVKESWFKVLTFPLVVCHAHALVHNTHAFPLLSGEGSNTKIFIDNSRNDHYIAVYSIKDDALSTLTNTIGVSGVHIYVQSLVSP